MENSDACLWLEISVISGLLILGKFFAAMMWVGLGNGLSVFGSGVVVRLRLDVRMEVGWADESVPFRLRVPGIVVFCAASGADVILAVSTRVAESPFIDRRMPEAESSSEPVSACEATDWLRVRPRKEDATTEGAVLATLPPLVRLVEACRLLPVRIDLEDEFDGAGDDALAEAASERLVLLGFELSFSDATRPTLPDAGELTGLSSFRGVGVGENTGVVPRSVDCFHLVSMRREGIGLEIDCFE